MVTCWERADLLALVGDVYCIFVTFPCGIPGQMWYMIVSFPDLCCLQLTLRNIKIYHAAQSCMSIFTERFGLTKMVVRNPRHRFAYQRLDNVTIKKYVKFDPNMHMHEL